MSKNTSTTTTLFMFTLKHTKTVLFYSPVQTGCVRRWAYLHTHL